MQHLDRQTFGEWKTFLLPLLPIHYFKSEAQAQGDQIELQTNQIAPRTIQIWAFMILDLVIAHPPQVGGIFNHTTGSGMSNSTVKVMRTSRQTAKHTQGVWEIIVASLPWPMCSLGYLVSKGLGNICRRACLTVSSDQPHSPCEKNKGKLCNYYNFFAEKRGVRLVWEKTLLVYKLIPREQGDLLRWTHPAATSLKSLGPAAHTNSKPYFLLLNLKI